MVLRLGAALIPQILMIAGIFLYIAKTHDRKNADEQLDQKIEPTVESMEGIEV